MPLSTDLSRSPYYDDFNVDKNFYRVLYRPGTAVQTRELNQMQTILQDQIDKFGRHIFKEGSVVEGCSFTFDNAYEYVKIGDTYSNGYAFTITDFQDKYVYNTNGLTAIIVNTVSGYIAQDPDLNTLYIKYLNVGTFGNGSPQNVFISNESITVSSNQQSSNTSAVIGNISIANVTDSSGRGYAFTTTKGTIFQKGFFVTVQPQTLIVSKYSNTPTDISIGFNSIENIITPEADTSLLDNAAGSPNYAAPGAHRLQLLPTLFTTTTNQLPSNTSFFSLVDFKDGVPVTIRNTAEYAALGKQLAQRTFETNGNYIVSPFILSTETKAIADPLYHDYINLVSTSGIGYVEGNRVEFVNNNKIALRKGTDVENIPSQIVSTNYGNYVYIDEYTGDFDTENIIKVELHNIAKTSISSSTFLSTGYSSTTKIGTAYVKNLAYDSGQIGTNKATYRLYLFNIAMNPGQNFSNVKSIINYNSSVLAVADVVLQYNASFEASIASIQYPILDTMIFPLGQKALTSDGFKNTQFVYKNKATAAIACTGIVSVSLPAVTGTGNENYNVSGFLDNQQISSFLVIPTATVSSTNKTGTVSASSGTKIVTGTSTTFINDYKIGDFIKINSEINSITYIANSTYLTVKDNFVTSPSANTHSKTFIEGVPIDYTQLNRSVSVSGDVATFTLGETLNSTLQTSIYHDILRSNSVSIKKNIVRNAFVKIDCSNNVAGNTGPWSLGLPNVARINNVYIGYDHNYSNSVADSSLYFNFYNGENENLYDLATLRLINTN